MNGPPTGREGASVLSPFLIDYDAERRIIHVRLFGIWSIEMVRDYSAALYRIVRPADMCGGRVALLVDSTQYPIQPREISVAFEQKMVRWRQWPMAHIIIVTGSVLAKLQVERTFGDSVTVFPTMDAARTWLDDRWPEPTP